MNVPDELDEKFRKAVARRKGLRRGSMKEAVLEAVRLWIDQEE